MTEFRGWAKRLKWRLGKWQMPLGDCTARPAKWKRAVRWRGRSFVDSDYDRLVRSRFPMHAGGAPHAPFLACRAYSGVGSLVSA